MYNVLDIQKSTELGLTFGTALTEDQRSKLITDIIWYVKQTIDLGNGETYDVLVPQMYLSKAHRDLLQEMNNNGELQAVGNGSTMSGKDIAIYTEANLNNIGNSAITATNNLLILANNDINNKNGAIIRNLNSTYTTTDSGTGSIDTYNTVFRLIAGNDINNIGSQIKANTNETATIYAENNINNETTKVRLSQPGGYKDIIRNEAVISNSGETGSLLIQANTGSLTNTGAEISVNGSVQIIAGNDIVFNTLELENYSKIASKKTSLEIGSLTNVGSKLTVGDNLYLSSGNDTNITGSDLNVNENASIQTGGDLNIESAEDTYHYESRTKKKGTFSSKKSSTVIDTTTNIASNLNVGGSLDINSDGSINLIASNMSSGGDMTLQADKSINIISGEDKYSKVQKSSSSKMISSKMSTNIHQTTTQVQSNLKADGDLTTFSGDDTNIIETNLQSKSGEISLVAGQYLDENGEIAVNTDANINIVNAYDTTYDYSKTVKAGLKLNDIREIAKAAVIDTISNYYKLYNGNMNLNNNLTAASLLSYEIKIDNEGILTKTVVSSNINAENGINIQSSGDTTLLASKLKSQNGDININAGTIVDKDNNIVKNESASITIAGATGSTTSNSEHVTGKLGLTFTNTGVDAGKYISNENANMNTTNVASEVVADNGNVIINAQSDINILASKLKATEGSIGLTAENGNVNISSINDYSNSKSQSNESTIGLNLASGNGSIGFNFAEFMDTKNTTIKTTNIASELDVENGDLIIDAKNDIGIIGSNLTTTNGSIGLITEDGDITITSGKNYFDSETQTMKGTIGLSIDKNLTLTTGSFLDINEDHGTSTNVASNITANGGSVIVNSGDNILIQASDINGDDGVLLTSQGVIEILAGLDSEWSSYDRKEGINKLAFKTTKSELSAKVGLRYEQESNSSNKTTVVGSNVVSNSGSINGDSEDSIMVAGSNLVANQDIILEAKNDLSILSSEEVEKNQGSFFMIDVGLKAGIYTNILTALDTVKDLLNTDIGDAIGGATGIITQITQTTDLDEILSGNEEGVNTAMKGLEVYQLLKEGPSVSADISVNVEIAGSKHKDATTNSVGSLLLAGNDIDLTTETGDINIEGSVLQANNDINLDSANDINIKSAENTYSSKDSGYNLEFDVSVIGQGFSINGEISGAKSSATTHNNSVLYAGNDFNSTSENDTNIIGANITAENDINMDIGNNLTLQSEQNTSDSKNFSFNLGGGTSGSGGNVNAGFQHGYTDRDWVDNQTSIIGNNSVNVNVGTREEEYLKDDNGNYILDDNGNKIVTKEAGEGNTNIIGAVIASGSYDDNGNFTDNSNLTLNTETLTYNNIYDEDKGLQVGLSGGISQQGKKTTGSISFNYGSHDIEQTTYATIGNGTIIIAGNEVNKENNNTNLIRDLNRNVTNSQVNTKNQTVDTIEGTIKFGLEKKTTEEVLQSWIRADKAVTGAIKNAAVSAGNYELANDITKIETNYIDPILQPLADKTERVIITSIEYTNNGITTIGKGVILTLQGTETVIEFIREGLEDKTIVGTVASQPFSAVEGFLDYFVEDDSYVVINGEKIYNPTEEQLKSAKSHYDNGINNIEDDLARYLRDHQDTVIRYNPTSGVTGAMSILSWKDIRLDDSQTMKAVRPAVYETMWNYKGDQIANNVEYVHDKDDGVRNVTAPRTPVHVLIGLWDLITNMDKHNVSNSKYN